MNIKEQKAIKLEGTVVKQRGPNMNAKCIKYINSMDVIVEFEDGTIKHCQAATFKSGQVGNPNCNPPKYPENYQFSGRDNHVGDRNLMRCGLWAEITEWVKSTDTAVRFDDGHIIPHVTFDNFKKGNVAHPNINTRALNCKKKYVGMQIYVASCKQNCKIIDYVDSSNVLAEFEDGTQVQTCMSQFKKGYIVNPTAIKTPEQLASERLNERRLMKCGFYATIVRYVNSDNIEVSFEIPGLNKNDTVKRTTYYFFENGLVGTPVGCTKTGTSRTERYFCQYIFGQVAGSGVKFNYGKKKKEFLNGLEADAYDPEKNIAIEFLGSHFHDDEDVHKRDIEKVKLCKQKGITLIRIIDKEYKYEFLEDDIILESYSENDIEKAGNEFVKRLGMYYE